MYQLLARLGDLHIDQDLEDRRIWKVASGGDFSVRSYYCHIDKSRQILGPWNDIWYNGIPPKVHFFSSVDCCFGEDLYDGFAMEERFLLT